MMGRVMLDIDDGIPLAGLRQKQAICGNCSANSARIDGSAFPRKKMKEGKKKEKRLGFKLLEILKAKRENFKERTKGSS